MGIKYDITLREFILFHEAVLQRKGKYVLKPLRSQLLAPFFLQSYGKNDQMTQYYVVIMYFCHLKLPYGNKNVLFRINYSIRKKSSTNYNSGGLMTSRKNSVSLADPICHVYSHSDDLHSTMP